MAPRKSDENTAKKTPRKKTVKPKPEKPKLKTPTVLRIRFPVELLGPNGITSKVSQQLEEQPALPNDSPNKTPVTTKPNKKKLATQKKVNFVIEGTTVPNGVTPKVSKKQLAAQAKLHLANEASNGLTLNLKKNQLVTPTKQVLAGPNGIVPKLKRKLVPEEKLELANEVALAALRSPKDNLQPVDFPDALLQPKTSAKGKRKSTSDVNDAPKVRKRGKKDVKQELEEEEVVPEIQPAAVVSNQKTKTAKKRVIKTPAAKIVPPDIKDEKKEPPKPVASRGRGRPKFTRGSTRLLKIAATPAPAEITDTKPVTPPNVEIPDCDIKIDKEEDEGLKTEAASSAPATKLVRCARRSTRKRSLPKKYIPDAAPGPLAKAGPEGAASTLGNTGRKTSFNSNRSELSWAHDISASSTTTCVTVTSTDLVRLDNKFPVVQMVKMKEIAPKPAPETETEADDSGSSSSSGSSSAGRRRLSGTSSASSASRDSPPRPFSPALPYSPLSARARSSSPSSPSAGAAPPALDELAALVAAMARSLERLPRAPAPPPRGRGAREERDVLAECERLSRALADEPEFARPATPRAPPAPPADDFTSDRVRYTSFEQGADDDDALSLFAESITGMDSTRASVASARAPPDEYVPAPLAPRPSELRYRPTRIDPPPRRPPVCEKHSADSTSVRDGAGDPPPPGPAGGEPGPARERREARPWLADEREPRPRPPEARPRPPGSRWEREPTPTEPEPGEIEEEPPGALSGRVPPVPPAQSAVFRGLCFYNLAAQCSRAQCRFVHASPGAEEVARRVAALPTAAFLRELALVAASARLRRHAHVAPALLAECARRGLARALLEHAVLFARAAPEAHAQAVLEVALRHVTAAGLAHVADLAAAEAGGALLRALSDTQNFSRFRPAFVALAAAGERPVPLAVATKILERVSILPPDEALARAALALAARAPREVFATGALRAFERQLAALGGPLRDELAALRAARASPERPAPPDKVIRPLMEIECDARAKRYTSPDTTHPNGLNNLPVKPMITRTVDFTRSLTNTTIVAFDPTVPPPTLQPNKLSKQCNTWHNSFQKPRGRGRGQGRGRGSLTRIITHHPVPLTYGAHNKYQHRSSGDYKHYD